VPPSFYPMTDTVAETLCFL